MPAPRYLLLVLAMICPSFGWGPAHAQTADASSKRLSPWAAASLNYGTVDAKPASNTDGIGLELSGGIEVQRDLRVGVQFVEWSEFPKSLFDPHWRARTIKGVVGYRLPHTIFAITGGLGLTRAWDEVAPRGSVRALLAGTGFELVAPPSSRLGFRFCVARDWAIEKWQEKGPLGFGTMNQWHVGIGASVH